jgi:hypothetical protein
MTCAAAVISPMVSFLTRRPVIMAAIITGESSPLHDQAHQVQHFVVEDFAVLDGALQRFLGGDGHGFYLLEGQAEGASVQASLSPKPMNRAPATVQPVHATLHSTGTPRHPRRGQRPARVDRNGVDVEQHPQQHERQGLVVGARCDELRHKGQKEDGHLGVEHIGPEAAQEHAAQRSRHRRGRLRCGNGRAVAAPAAREQHAHAHPQQVGGAQPT